MAKQNAGKTNANMFLCFTTKEGSMRFAHTYSSEAEAKEYLDWIKRIPEIEQRLTTLENRFNSCPNCS